MTTIKDGGPAFPVFINDEVIISNLKTDPKLAGELANMRIGMSLRDWFAGMALQGIMSKQYMEKIPDGYPPAHRASEAYRYADAMLEERTKT